MKKAPSAVCAFEKLWMQVKTVLRRHNTEAQVNAIVRDMTGKRLREALDRL